MQTEYELKSDAERPIVYVRPVAVADLPESVRPQAGDATRVYAIHNEEGTRLALVGDEALAFVLAEQNDMSPVRVH